MTEIPYYPISQYYHKRFQEKVYKIPVSVADSCPNRMGLKGMKTCVFCDEWGSAAHSEAHLLTLDEQIEKYSMALRQKYRSKSFLVYFQAYTNTFTKITTLQGHFQTAAQYDFVKGFVVGTRPDCISKMLFDLWNHYAQSHYMSVEMGVQSFFNDKLEFMQRGHSREASLKALEQIARECPEVDLGIHLIFGSPSETDAEIIESAKICNDLPISNVKLHNLHVLKNTELAKLYQEGSFYPIEFAEYAHRVALFLEHLSPKIAVHRLAALSSRRDELIAPDWTARKMETHQRMIDYLKQNGIYQGKQYGAQGILCPA